MIVTRKRNFRDSNPLKSSRTISLGLPIFLAQIQTVRFRYRLDILTGGLSTEISTDFVDDRGVELWDTYKEAVRSFDAGTVTQGTNESIPMPVKYLRLRQGHSANGSFPQGFCRPSGEGKVVCRSGEPQFGSPRRGACSASIASLTRALTCPPSLSPRSSIRPASRVASETACAPCWLISRLAARQMSSSGITRRFSACRRGHLAMGAATILDQRARNRLACTGSAVRPPEGASSLPQSLLVEGLLI